MAGSIHAHVVEGTRIKVEIESDQGATPALEGDLTDLEPAVVGGGVLEDNPALLSNMWAYAKTWCEAHATSPADALAVSDPEAKKLALKELAERQKVAQKCAVAHAKVAQWIADVADDVSPYQPKNGWCSSCFFKTEHRKSNRPAGQLPVYVCQGCGAATLPCVPPSPPRCDNMAVRERGALRVPQYCAEHRNDIAGFEKAHARIGELHDYEDFLKYEKSNLNKTSELVAVGVFGVTAAAPLALLAAPAVGGAIGSLGMFGGFSAAAATSHGLALLGGGSLAAGGLGVAGGTSVVTAVGAAVGGTLGASASIAYLREDKILPDRAAASGQGWGSGRGRQWVPDRGRRRSLGRVARDRRLAVPRLVGLPPCTAITRRRTPSSRSCTRRCRPDSRLPDPSASSRPRPSWSMWTSRTA